MSLANVKCFGCQNYGHLERDCPDKSFAAELGDGDKPPWCGMCDRVTRLVAIVRDGRELARRCETCHPSSHLLAAQFKRCGTCRAVIYEWDLRSECGTHQPVSKPIPVRERKAS